MVILALDTSTRTGSCAVVRDGRVLAETAGDAVRSHGERLPAEVGAALDAAGVALSDVDLFAVAVGPGSFTGLRVGIATMQGLAMASARPLIGVSVLDALARIAASPGVRVATWVDAWRGEVYASLYDGGSAAEPIVDRPERLLSALHPLPVVFIGDGAAVHRERILRDTGPWGRIAPVVEPLLAGTIGQMAAARAAEGLAPGPDEIRPLYVRRPDAELARDAGAGR